MDVDTFFSVAALREELTFFGRVEVGAVLIRIPTVGKVLALYFFLLLMFAAVSTNGQVNVKNMLDS